MRVYEKETGRCYDLFDVTYDKVGYPQFLIYKDGQWLRRSAKYFTPTTKPEDIVIDKTPSGICRAFKLN